jgi:hypothetical protein
MDHLEPRRNVALVGMLLVSGVLSGGIVRADEAVTGYAFTPRPTTLLGSNVAGDSQSFTRIFNQAKGELAIKQVEWRSQGGLSLNWSKVLQILVRPDPVVGYMTLVVGSDVVHLVIRVDLAHSDLPRTEVAVEFFVTDTTLPIPVGTVFGGASWRRIPGGIAEDHGRFTTGLLPATNAQASTLAFFILPGIIRNPTHRARIDIEYSFVSVDPPDGSAPLTATPKETLTIDPAAKE